MVWSDVLPVSVGGTASFTKVPWGWGKAATGTTGLRYTWEGEGGVRGGEGEG